MLVLKLRSPVAALAAGLLVLTTAWLLFFRVETVWSVESEVVVAGRWGVAEGEFGRATGADGRLRGPQAVAVDGAGNVAVADSLNGRVQVFSPEGELLGVIRVPEGRTAVLPAHAERAAAHGLLEACLAWGPGFRPRPDLPGPAAAAPAQAEVPAAARPGFLYVTDIDLSGGSWRVDRRSGRLDPASGPRLHLLAGWEGTVITMDITGVVHRRLDLLPSGRAAAAPGYVLDIDAFPDGDLVVFGYVLPEEGLVQFVRLVEASAVEAVDLCSVTIRRDGSVTVDEDLPVRLDVESVAAGHDGLLYLAAAPAAPPPAGAPGGGPGGASPFSRQVWVFSRRGKAEGRFRLDCEGYTLYLRLLGTSGRGLVFARLGSGRSPGMICLFDRKGTMLLRLPLPAEAVEVADVYLTAAGVLYVSVADDEGYRVLRYRVGGSLKPVPRWGGR